MTSPEIETERVPVDILSYFPGNARRSDMRVIKESLDSLGQYRAIVVQRSTRQVLAGNHLLQALRERGEETVLVHWVDVDDETARRIVLADNRTSDLGTYDESALLDLLKSLPDLQGTGWSDDAIDTLLAGQSGVIAASELEGARDLKPSPRVLPLDTIFTLSRLGQVYCGLAAEAGLQVGTMSAKTDALEEKVRAVWELRYPIVFVDNEWHGYDHKVHLDFVREIRPKYATVRDAMTKDQCAASGVEYFPLERVLEMAEEVGRYAENVIIIPKYDCIDKIPEKFVLGYSVPTAYGATPLPASAFKGRRVHLLGGSWANQLRYLALLGDDVVSLDHNHCLKIARFGQFVLPDGSTESLR